MRHGAGASRAGIDRGDRTKGACPRARRHRSLFVDIAGNPDSGDRARSFVCRCRTLCCRGAARDPVPVGGAFKMAAAERMGAAPHHRRRGGIRVSIADFPGDAAGGCIAWCHCGGPPASRDGSGRVFARRRKAFCRILGDGLFGQWCGDPVRSPAGCGRIQSRRPATFMRGGSCRVWLCRRRQAFSYAGKPRGDFVGVGGVVAGDDPCRRLVFGGQCAGDGNCALGRICICGGIQPVPWFSGVVPGACDRRHCASGATQLLQVFLTLFASALLLGEKVDALEVGFAATIVLIVALGRRMPVRRA